MSIDDIVRKHLETPEGKAMMRQAIQDAALRALAKCPPGSLRHYLARKLAGLPPLYLLH